MKRIFWLIALLILIRSTDAQKIFTGFKQLQSPRVDSNIIGKYKEASGLYTGTGTKDMYMSDSYSDYSKQEQTKFGLDVEATIQKMIEMKLSLSDSNYRVLTTGGLHILQCTDLMNLRGESRGFNAGDRYVVAAVMVGSFSLVKGNDLTSSLVLKPEELTKLGEIFDGKLEFNLTSKSYNFKKGTNLIVAEKLLTITSAESYNIGPANEPYFDVKVNDIRSRQEFDISPGKGSIDISFVNYSKILPAEVGEDAVEKHMGCLKMRISHQQYLPEGKYIIICPDCPDQMGNLERVDCRKYLPDDKFAISHSRWLFTAKLKNTMYEYFMTVTQFVVDYKYPPNEDSNNYRMEGDNKVTAKINLSRNVVKYKID